MINSLFFIFMLVLLLIPLSSAQGQTARDTVIHSAIDGDNNPVPNGGSTTSTSITFIYSEVIDNQPQADKFKCRLDGSGSDPFVDCTNFIDFPANFNSTVTYPPPTLQLGMHKFEVIACMTPGPNEICDKSPATWTWFIVDFNTFITSAIDSSDVNVTQDGMTNYDDITFNFTGKNSQNVVVTVDGFECSLDGGNFTDCTAGATQSYSNLTAGNHTFMVSAFFFNNTGMPKLDITPAEWRWTITTDTVIDTAIDSSDVNVTQDGMTNYDDITFTYHATLFRSDNPDTPVNATADGFVCSLDFADFTDCTPGATPSYSNLTAGNHTFMVSSFVFNHTGMQILDPTPAVFKWNIKQFDTVILSAIDGDSNSVLDGGSTPSKNITFTFSAIEVNTLQLMANTLQINTEDNEEIATPFNSSKIENDNSKEIPNSLSSLFKLVVPLFTYFNFSPLYTAQSLVSPVIAQEIFNVQPGLECMLDEGPFEDCSTGIKNYPDLSAGQHVFKVRWNISETEFDPSPANFTWTVEPDTIIDSAIDGNDNNVTNGGSTTSRFINFTFHAEVSEGPITVDGFKCSIDGGTFTECNSGTQLYSALEAGNHTFAVKWVNDGYEGQTTANFTWAILPNTVIDAAIDGNENQKRNG